MRLIVGLGNPGKKYEKTRHNIGFVIVSSFRFQFSNFSDWKFNKKFNAEVAVENVNHAKIILAKPQTFMNESGRAVRAAADFYKIKPADILIIHDDIDLPLGKIRIKKDGSSGGHQGVASIIASLGSQDFTRLKIGVGPKARPKGFDAAKFVLKNFAKNEEKTVPETIKKTTEALIIILSDGVQEAMNKFN